MKHFYILAFSILVTLVSFSQQMPIDFENSNHVFSGFTGSSFATVNDPTNSSNKVGQFNNNGSAADQGFYIDLNRDIDVTNQKEITLSFYAFDPNQHTITLKLENGANADVEVTKTVSSGNATNWQNLTFDFSNATFSGTNNATNASGTYSKLVIFIDLGVTTAGTYLLDNISDGSTPTDTNELDVIYNDLVWSDEFDENTLNRRSQFILPAIKTLKKAGITLVLDNFGSGLASLSYLYSYPFDYVKIDHHFIKTLPKSERNLKLIQSVLSISSHLKFKLIAEGINSQEQYDVLVEAGCEFGQGKFLQKPEKVSFDDTEEQILRA